MSSLNVEKVCRTCTLEKEDMQGIFDMVNCNGIELPISKVLSAFIQEFDSNEGLFLPTSICSKCTEHAIIAYNFKELCERSSILFRDYLGSLKDSPATKVEESVNNNHIDTSELMKVELGDSNELLTSDRKRNASSKAIEKIKTIIEYGSDDGLNDYRDCSDFEPEPDTGTSVKSEDELQPLEKRRRKRKSVKSKTKQADDSNTGQKAVGGTLDGIEKEIGNLHCCDYCDKWFKNKYTLISHRKRHQFKGQFLCNVCGKGYSSQSCLSRHSIVHTGEKKFECKVCHKRFPSAYNLSLHSRTHSGLKPYLCTVCGKKFRHPTGLTYHMRTHTQEKPYACEVCGKRFSVQCNFDRHKKIHSGERPFVCSQCGKAFIKKIDLQRHEQIHTGYKPFACEHCTKSFLRKKNLIYHMMLHTEERPHVCIECNKGFIRSYYLNDHIKKHHSTSSL